MNNQRSGSDQLILFFLLSVSAFLIYNQFFGHREAATGPVRTVPAFSAAFAGIDTQNPATKTLLATATAKTEEAKLLKAIDSNKDDAYSYWARLRAGLLEQYLISPKDSKPALKHYEEVINHAAGDDVEAQALYQKGDLLWRAAEASGGSVYQSATGKDAVGALEQLVRRGRGASLLDLKIYVPKEAAGKSSPDSHIPEQGFELVPVSSLRTGSNGILDRVDQYYSNTIYYKVFDTVVKALGNQPAYSFGIAIIFFATITRLILQPLNKKQYETTKGMAVIAPEMKKIQERYKNKPDQQATMMKEIQALQRKHGVNPMLGCGLALIQMPVFFLVVYPLIQHYQAKMELVGASFLWVHNLAEPDIALLVLYAFSMFLSVRLSSMPATDDMQRQQQMMMSFMMPLMFPFFLKGYPSAFIMYWSIFSLISTVFQYRMMKAADPTKSLVKSLLASPGAMPKAIDQAVPERPKGGPGKDGAARDKGKEAGHKGLKDKDSGSAPNHGANGTSNGVAKLTAVGVESDGGGPWSPVGNGAFSEDSASEDDGEDATGAATTLSSAAATSPGDKSGGDGNRRNGTSQRARRRRRY